MNNQGHELVIRFIGAHDAMGRLIQLATNSLWCHTEALSRDGAQWIGAHAFTGVQARPLNWCDPSREALYALPVSAAMYDRSMTWLEEQARIRRKYDYKGIFGLALHRRLHAGGALDCSNLMLRYMWQAGLQPLNCLEGFAYLVTPETLHLSPVFIGRRINGL